MPTLDREELLELLDRTDGLMAAECVVALRTGAEIVERPPASQLCILGKRGEYTIYFAADWSRVLACLAKSLPSELRAARVALVIPEREAF